jgi:type IV pilus assembly protein PilE
MTMTKKVTALAQPSFGIKGFTLIELMITVAVIGVLSAIAIPSYNDYINRGRRADAQVQLQAAQLWMERFYGQNYRYDEDTSGTAVSFANQPFANSPQTGQGPTAYTLSLTAVARNSYTLTATRSSSGRMASDGCGNFTLTNAGLKGLASQATGKTVADCWR